MSEQLNPVAGKSVSLHWVKAASEYDMKGFAIRSAVIEAQFRDSHNNLLPQYKCKVHDIVVKSTATKHLHFYLGIQYVAGGPNMVFQAWRRNFPTTVFVGWRADGLTGIQFTRDNRIRWTSDPQEAAVQPTRATREERVSPIIFQLGGIGSNYKGIPVGMDSRYFYLKTDASDYKVEGETILVLMNGETASITTAQPSE